VNVVAVYDSIGAWLRTVPFPERYFAALAVAAGFACAFASTVAVCYLIAVGLDALDDWRRRRAWGEK
jgi:hypothetical protein